MRTQTLALLGALITASFATFGNAHELAFSAGQPGDPTKPSRTIEVEMTEEYGLSTFTVKRIEVKRGEQIRFVLRNSGKLNHEFILATTADNLKHAAEMRKNPDMEHDDPNAAALKPGAKGELIWRFTKRGTFEFACLLPGHREEGMVGTIVVK